MAFGQSQQERENQTVESMVAGLLSQLQQPNSEDQSYQGLKEGHGRIRIGAGSSDPKGRVISQIPWSHHEQQQSRASISTLLASLDPSTLQSLMAGAPANTAAQPANTVLHRQEPSLDLSQIMSLGLTLEQALQCYRSLWPDDMSASVSSQSQQLSFTAGQSLQQALATLSSRGTTASEPEPSCGLY
jgi:hypothetical protein